VLQDSPSLVWVCGKMSWFPCCVVVVLVFISYHFGSNDCLETFTVPQTIPTRGAHTIKGFTIGEKSYFAVVNHYNLSAACRQGAEVYEYDIAGNTFVLHQTWILHGALSLCTFSAGGTHYLTVTVETNSGCVGGTTTSIVYKWNLSRFRVSNTE